MAEYQKLLERRTFLKTTAVVGMATVVGSTPAVGQDETTIELGGETSGWVGRSPDYLADQTNPALQLEAGTEYTIIWENVDGSPHNIAMLDADGNELQASPIMDQSGETQEFTFTATEEMVEYYCRVHPGSMRGQVQFGGGGGDGTQTPTETQTPEPELPDDLDSHLTQATDQLVNEISGNLDVNALSDGLDRFEDQLETILENPEISDDVDESFRQLGEIGREVESSIADAGFYESADERYAPAIPEFVDQVAQRAENEEPVLELIEDTPAEPDGAELVASIRQYPQFVSDRLRPVEPGFDRFTGLRGVVQGILIQLGETGKLLQQNETDIKDVQACFDAVGVAGAGFLAFGRSLVNALEDDGLDSRQAGIGLFIGCGVITFGHLGLDNCFRPEGAATPQPEGLPKPEQTETSTETSTPTPETSPTPEETETPDEAVETTEETPAVDLPGFGVLAALGGIGSAAGYLLSREDED